VNLEELLRHLAEAQKHIEGFIYPNEIELHWGLVVILYPYITGLVAGAFILASLERVFNVKELQPTYRLSLLTALAFLLVAPLPLLVHLGHPERAFEIFLTPHLESAMAVFGFVYAWYLSVVLLLEIWFDYRGDIVGWSQRCRGWKRILYTVLTLGVRTTSDRALSFDERAGRFVTIVGIPSAFLLHGYVGFIFGSVKANPWWSSVLMPVVFLFSAIVSGIALVLVIYMVASWVRRVRIDMSCLDKLAKFLFYALILDVSLELLDFIHRLYEAEESIDILAEMVQTRLLIPLVVIQGLIGTLVPLIALAGIMAVKPGERIRRAMYFGSGVIILIAIFFMRWNVVLGGQLFSKSLRGLTVYKMGIAGREGVLAAITLAALPFVILFILTRILPPWQESKPPPECPGTGK
jgi:Ni/Fe-hydrogenase subunit HybB-like protein